MPKIIMKNQLSENVFRMRLTAPLISQERKAGQFIILQLDKDWGERIPLTIAQADPEGGTIDLVFQTLGATTRKLSQLNEGDEIANLLGPLGTPTHIQKYDRPVVCVGGGIGVAPMNPIVEAHKKAGNRVISIMGARSKELVIMEEEIRSNSDEVIICTDDGSYGRKSLVTEPLKELCESDEPPAEVIAIGPPIMMKFCALTTKPYNVKTTVSLNTIMVDGTGMCGGCRVNIGGETKFVCVDGPEFDGHKVDFDNMMKRLNTYKDQETEHNCRLEAAADKLEARQ
ncbi:MAG: sulfide/dihydroorotate dehydrogenase-like FAD/NAD-binding protein [Spirochaetales bacterium]|nr:sulfide/dihydroorotate dehydrogenase-like FAD/NAD-binding protein [Spirochaetales bacterium]